MTTNGAGVTNGRLRERERFLDCLREGGNVSLACVGAGLSRNTAYRWRRADSSFAEEWDAAMFQAGCPLFGDDWNDALENQRKRSASSYVYLIRESWRGLVKIGVAHNPASRFRDLQNSCPQELVIIGLIPVDNAARLERKLHKRFSKKRYRGEWFSLSDKDIRATLEEYGAEEPE